MGKRVVVALCLVRETGAPRCSYGLRRAGAPALGPMGSGSPGSGGQAHAGHASGRGSASSAPGAAPAPGAAKRAGGGAPRGKKGASRSGRPLRHELTKLEAQYAACAARVASLHAEREVSGTGVGGASCLQRRPPAAGRARVVDPPWAPPPRRLPRRCSTQSTARCSCGRTACEPTSPRPRPRCVRTGAAAALAAAGGGAESAAALVDAFQLPLQEAALRSCVEQLDTLSSHFRALGVDECGAPGATAAACGGGSGGHRPDGAAEAAGAGAGAGGAAGCCDAPLGLASAAEWLADELGRGGGAAATMRAAIDAGPVFVAARSADFVRAAGVALFK